MHLNELIAMKPSLDKLATTQLPAALSVRVADALVIIAQPLHDASQAHLDLYHRLGVIGEDGTQMVIPESTQAEYHAAMGEMLQSEVDVSGLPSISLADFEDTLVEPSVLIAIRPLLAHAPT